MNPEIKKQWVEALRSGDYSQCQNRLNKDGGHCCLGVLSELAVRSNILKKSASSRGTAVTYRAKNDSFDESMTTLPVAAQQWAGLADSQAINQLIDLNDNHNKNFNEIADFVEANL